MEKIRIGVIGLGQRGYGLLVSVLLKLNEFEVTALCDIYQDRIDKALIKVKDKENKEPFVSTNYEDILEKNDVDAVLIATSWEMHITIACMAMECGKITAMEVGGANSENDCWKLVRTYEETKIPFMFMENCCFDKSEMMLMAMIKDNVLGKIVNCSGSYSHDLREEVSGGFKNKHYRLRNYIDRNCENYPTHELGPISKMMNINTGNRMVSLVSVASCAEGLKSYIQNNDMIGNLGKYKFNQGDVIHTIVKCAGGETILLRLDTTVPCFYNRDIVIKGTKGMYNQMLNAVYLDEKRTEEYWTGFENAEHYFNNAKKFEEKYLPDIWKNTTQEELDSGHGGMDGFEFKEFAKAVLNNKKMPIDVYDAASWMCISYLSEKSIALGGNQVYIPDFTNGRWMYATDPNMQTLK